jgi:hypothetical protein
LGEQGVVPSSGGWRSFHGEWFFLADRFDSSSGDAKDARGNALMISSRMGGAPM